MPAVREIVIQYACNNTFAFNLNTTLSAAERAPDGTVVTAHNPVLPGRLNRAATGCPDQSTYHNRGNVCQFHK